MSYHPHAISEIEIRDSDASEKQLPRILLAIAEVEGSAY